VVWCEGEIDPATGFCGGIDYSDISHFAKAYVVDILDHQNINDYITPYSTAEYLAIWIYNRLEPYLPALRQVDVYETPTSCVSYVIEK
jgi:6-pyruvoyl-tetrahydropterin synthase